MNRNLEEHVIRERAHALWEQEGRPQGREEEHWHRAMLELAVPTAKPNATRARRGKAAGARSKKAA
jgi:hypothetical protein